MGGGGGDGEKQQQKNYPQEIIDKNIFLRILARKYMPKEGKKKFSTLHVQKKIMHLLKSALLYIHPHRTPPPPPSLF